MKYSFFVKFLALVLCAAALLGVVACAGSLAVMTSGGLYNRTVEEMMEENIRQDGALLARQLSSRFASVELGGVPAEVARQCFPSYPYRAFNGNYGYALKDGEGNVVDSLNAQDPANARVYSFPVSGQYISLVSCQSEAERYPAVDQTGSAQTVMADGVYIYDAVPDQGVSVTRMMVTYADGGTAHYDSDTALGTAYRTGDGKVLCMITDPATVLPGNVTVNHMILAAGEELVYEASFADGVGYFTVSGGCPVFVSAVAGEYQIPETQPEETAPETVPETLPETLPPETVPETVPETAPETAAPFVPPVVTDNVPQEGNLEVTVLAARLQDGTEIYHEDKHGLGSVSREAGEILFVAYEAWNEKAGTAVAITLLDGNDDILFEASHAEGIGHLYMSKDHLCFRAAIPQPPVVETVPETVPVTEAETQPETVPETVPVTEAETLPPETAPQRPTHINGKPLMEYDILTTAYTDSRTGENMYVEYVYVPLPEYTLELYLTEASIPGLIFYELLETVRQMRSWLLPGLGVSLLLFVLLGIYLLVAAARSPGTGERQAGGLNRIPLDLYLVLAGLGVPCLIAIVAGTAGEVLEQSLSVGAALVIGCTFGASLLAVGFLFALAAQVKTPGGFWWRNLLCSRIVRGIFRLIGWLDRQNREYVLPVFVRLGNGLWSLCSRAMVRCYRILEKFCLGLGELLGGFLRWNGRVLHRFLSLLPITWQWLLGGVVLLAVTGAIGLSGSPLMKLLCLGIGIFLIVYGAHCFGSLLESVRKMRRGDLNTRVDDKIMVGTFRDFAGELNALAGVAVVAARKQMGSHRNEDLAEKTREPLAAMGDLTRRLRDELTEAERTQTLDALREELRKLERLLDPNDAADALTVKIHRLDAVEAVAQVLESYADKLANAHLTPVVKYADSYASMLADEWMLWRSISILLDNAVAHALAGTRVYLDVTQTEDQVCISLRNVSREIPEQSPEALAEAAGANGSGLGIAASLMQLQNGEIRIQTDGDLFKTTLVFPRE